MAMRIVRTETLISSGPFSASERWHQLREQIRHAVQAAEWPPGSGSFTIRPESGKQRGQGNGVKPIKDASIHRLTNGNSYKSRHNSDVPIQQEWVSEAPWPAGERVRPGNMDAAYYSGPDIICFEWETGNISSSHRSVNKMCLGLLQGSIKAGILVVPSRELAQYLTDRIGNIGELEPYFPLWRATPCNEGVLEIIVIEHDSVSDVVARIPKGTDGRATN